MSHLFANDIAIQSNEQKERRRVKNDKHRPKIADYDDNE